MEGHDLHQQKLPSLQLTPIHMVRDDAECERHSLLECRRPESAYAAAGHAGHHDSCSICENELVHRDHLHVRLKYEIGVCPQFDEDPWLCVCDVICLLKCIRLYGKTLG